MENSNQSISDQNIIDVLNKKVDEVNQLLKTSAYLGYKQNVHVKRKDSIDLKNIEQEIKIELIKSY